MCCKEAMKQLVQVSKYKLLESHDGKYDNDLETEERN
jgi:hypothetical protein